MQLGDVANAGASYDILADYFNNNFSEVKLTDKRHGKRRQHHADPLNESRSIPVLSPSPGLGPFDVAADASPLLSDLSVTPIIRRNNGGRGRVSESSSVRSGLTTESGAESFSRKPDLNVQDLHNVADLVHRLTHRTGLQPGQVRVTKTPDSVVEKAAHIADLQFKELRYSDRMQRILSEVMEVNERLSAAIPAVTGHRRELGRTIEEANKMYLRLFESMMSEILLIHRKKFKSQTKDLTELRAEKEKVDTELAELKKANEILRSRVNSTELEFDKLRSMLRARDKQVTVLSEEVERLDEIRQEYLQYMADIRAINARRDNEREELEARLRAEEQASLKAQLDELKAQFMRTQAMLKEAQANALERDMALNMETKAKKKVPTHESSSQTAYTDFNVFDKQDGWILPISGTAAARINWRRSLNFATCPACRGVGNQVMTTAVLLRQLIRGVVDQKKSRRAAGVWVIPDEICQFVCNLPRSIMAYRPYGLSWTVNRLSHIFAAKMSADEEDVAAGLPIQSLEQFIIEKYLMLTEERGQAETGIHRLLQSVKEHYKRHPLLHLFARFMSMLQDPGHSKVDDSTPTRRKSIRKKSMAQEMAMMDEMLKPSSRDLPVSVLSIYLFAREELLKPGYKGAYADAIAKAKISENGELLKYERMLTSASMKPPKTVRKYARKSGDEKQNGKNRRSSVSGRKQSVSAILSPTVVEKIDSEEEEFEHAGDDLVDPVSSLDMGSKWNIRLESHVCVLNNFTMWIPLDRAVEVVNKVLNFLSESQLLAVCRRIEHISAFLSPHGCLTSADGNHSEIRQHMRVFLRNTPVDNTNQPLSNFSEVADANISAFVEEQKQLEPSRQYTVVVNLDDALQTISEMLLTRISHMEEKLGRIFFEGDTNGDGILSYEEFLAIVNRIAPHLSERRVLGMYREVLLMGEDSEKIELPSFVSICKKYGLVKLVDLKEIFEKQNRGFPSIPNTATSSTNSTALSTPMYSFSESDADSPNSLKRNANLRRIDSIPEGPAEEVDEDIHAGGEAFQDSANATLAEEIDDEFFE